MLLHRVTEKPNWAYAVTKCKSANEDHYVWGIDYLISLIRRPDDVSTDGPSATPLTQPLGKPMQMS